MAKYERIKNLRDDKDWTQMYVSSKLHISQRVYSHYENGTRGIPTEILIAIADLYGVTLDYLVGRDTIK